MDPKKKNLIMGAIIVVAGAIAIYQFFGSSAKPEFPTDYTVQGVCLACRAESPLTQGIRVRPPFDCPKCSVKAVCPWYYCPTCKKRFVPPPEKGSDGVLRMPIVPSCPGCKGTNSAGYDPSDPEQTPGGDFDLPALPK